jgi:hypothetical protein
MRENYELVGEAKWISQNATVNIREYDDEQAGSTKAGKSFTSWVIIEF